MNEDATLIDTLFKRVTDFSMTYIELLKLKTVNRLTEVISTVLPDFIICLILGAFLLFGNLGLAIWLGDLTGKVYLGFLLVAVFYLFLGFILHFFMRGWLKKVTANYFIKRIFKED